RSPPSSPRRQLVTFLERCGVTEQELSEAEFEQLVSQFSGQAATRCRQLLDGNGKGQLARSSLKLLWGSVIVKPQSEATLPQRSPSSSTTDVQESVSLPATKPDEGELFPAPGGENAPSGQPSLDRWADTFELPSDERLGRFANKDAAKSIFQDSRTNLVGAL